MSIRSLMILIKGVIGLERLEFFAHELEKLLCLTVYTLASTMSLIMGVIRPEQLEFFALEFEKFLYFILFTL